MKILHVSNRSRPAAWRPPFSTCCGRSGRLASCAHEVLAFAAGPLEAAIATPAGTSPSFPSGRPPPRAGYHRRRHPHPVRAVRLPSGAGPRRPSYGTRGLRQGLRPGGDVSRQRRTAVAGRRVAAGRLDGVTFTTRTLAGHRNAPAGLTVLGKAADVTRFEQSPMPTRSTARRASASANLHRASASPISSRPSRPDVHGRPTRPCACSAAAMCPRCTRWGPRRRGRVADAVTFAGHVADVSEMARPAWWRCPRRVRACRPCCWKRWRRAGRWWPRAAATSKASSPTASRLPGDGGRRHRSGRPPDSRAERCGAGRPPGAGGARPRDAARRPAHRPDPARRFGGSLASRPWPRPEGAEMAWSLLEAVGSDRY